jgi:metal-responsive CopG/Arc/MetJ family transcriptional regulator
MADGTPFRRIRMTDDMWEKFQDAVEQAEPELDRSKVIREFIRWYLGETNDLPRRPEAAPEHRGRP